MGSKAGKVGVGISLFAAQWVSAEPAADDLPIINMDTVVVTATQTEEEAFTTAKSIDKVDDEQLAVEQPETVADSVKNLTNVNVNQGPRQLSQQVDIRGLTGKEVLQVLDNARQNFQNGHQGSFFIEPELLKEVEVLRGPASSLWGSGAIGGVVNMTTIDPNDLLKEDQKIGAKVKGGMGTADDLLYTSDSVFGRAGEHNQYLLNFSYRNTHDIEAGGGDIVPDSAYWDRSGMAKWVSELNENQTLRFSYIAFDAWQNVPSDPRQNDNGARNPLVDQNIYQQNWNATYEFEDPKNDWIDFTSTLYFNDTEVFDTCLGDCSSTSGGADREDSTTFQTLGLNAHNSSYFDLLTLTYGGEVYQDSTNGERNDDPRPQFPEAKTQVWAAYVQAEIPFWETWTLTPGVRYDHFRNDPEDTFSDSTGESLDVVTEGDTSPSVTLGWQATHWLGLYAIYDEAFRAPAIDELYPSGYHFGPNRFVPNPDLKPEKARNKEFSARMGWDQLLDKTDDLRMRATVFRNDIQNYIQQQIVSVTETKYENISNARISGFEFDATYRIWDWFASAGYGYVKGINEDPIKDSPYGGMMDETDYLDNIPPERIILNLGRYFYQDTLMAGVRFTHAWSQDEVSQPQNCSPDAYVPANGCPINKYTTLDLYATWQPSAPTWEDLRVDLAINNITDQFYYQSTSSLLPEEGRNVQLSASYLF